MPTTLAIVTTDTDDFVIGSEEKRRMRGMGNRTTEVLLTMYTFMPLHKQQEEGGEVQMGIQILVKVEIRFGLTEYAYF